MSQRITLAAAQKMPVGSYVVVQFYRSEGGHRAGAGRIRRISEDEIELTAFVPGDAQKKKIILTKTEEPRRCSCIDEKSLLADANCDDCRGRGRYIPLVGKNEMEYTIRQDYNGSAKKFYDKCLAAENPEPEVVELTPRDIALRLITVMDASPQSRKYWCRVADIDDSEVVAVVMQRLREAGKVRKVRSTDGKIKWRRPITKKEEI